MARFRADEDAPEKTTFQGLWESYLRAEHEKALLIWGRLAEHSRTAEARESLGYIRQPVRSFCSIVWSSGLSIFSYFHRYYAHF